MNLLTKIEQFFTSAKPLQQGMYHLQATLEDEKPCRLHLRLRSDGSGLMVVNAATVLHLNATAAEYAYHFIRGSSDEEASSTISTRYRVKKEQALQDFKDFVDRVQSLVHTPDLDPVSSLGMERAIPYDTALSAPLRLDCALTYRLPEGEKQEDAPEKNVSRELETHRWQEILDQAWYFGIPHIVFTGGEPCLRTDLPDLIAHAEKNGQVTGLLTDGLKLADKSYLQTLLQTGLDHLLITLQPDNKKSWKALETILPEDIFTTVHLTLTDRNSGRVEEILKKLSALGVESLSLSASPQAQAALPIARELASQLALHLTWDLPVPYSASNPVSLETEEENISGAGIAWLYVEPDGDVLPAQGMASNVLGNLLRSGFTDIYQKPQIRK